MAARKRGKSRIARFGGAALALVLFGQLQHGCGGSVEQVSPDHDAGTDSANDGAPDGADAQDAAEEGDASDAADSPDAPAQCPAREAMWQFVYANKSCSSASDCVVAKTCFTQAEGCGSILAGLYLSSAYDPQKLAEIEASLANYGETCCYIPGCDYVEPTVCWKQTCFKFLGDQHQAYRNKCHDQLGRNTLCATCVCSEYGESCNDYPDCIKLLQCAHDNACLGTPKCAPDNPASPCKALVDT